MGKDIIFKTDEYVFSYRVAGILVNDGKVLLQRSQNSMDYAIPGGHVALGDTNEETLIREFKEEMDADIEVGELRWVGELFFPWGASGKPCHQICLFYNVSLKENESIPLNGEFTGTEQLEDKTFKLMFSWVDIRNLENLEVYPIEAKEYLTQGSNKVEHFVYNEI